MNRLDRISSLQANHAELREKINQLSDTANNVYHETDRQIAEIESKVERWVMQYNSKEINGYQLADLIHTWIEVT